jgi:hypothetical protein
VDRTSRDVPAYALQSWGYFSGEARFGKRCYPVVLVDADGNGRFADTGRSFVEAERGDLLLVDLNRDGAFPEHDILDPKLHFLARSVRVEGRYYDLSVRADGTQLLAAPSRSTLATLRSDYGKFTLILGSEESLLVLRGERGRAQVPVGDYRLLGWQIEQCDRDGSIWKARGMSTRSGADARLLSVSAETILAGLAAPLTAKLSVAHITDGELQFGLQLTAASGERIQNLTRDDQLVPAPHVVLRDARGEEIASLSFHYG